MIDFGVFLQVSDGVIAPGYTDEALEILKKKKGGKYCVLKVSGGILPELSVLIAPPSTEVMLLMLAGITFVTIRNSYRSTFAQGKLAIRVLYRGAVYYVYLVGYVRRVVIGCLTSKAFNHNSSERERAIPWLVVSGRDTNTMDSPSVFDLISLVGFPLKK